ncbi:MAG: serine/threonine protein kinase [Ignavibacteria bacterium]|nr:serine/threonine protein kinase [Ignavibacteria bacterium]
MIGTRIGNYEINSFIEEGGMGTVYSGTHIKLDRKVAVKVLHKNLTSNSQFRERFLNEAKILAKLSHPNIINIYDFVEQDEQYYIITEFVEGISLDKIVADRNAATAEMKLEYFRQILSGIGYAHSHGVVHRDIKPSNVMIELNTTAKILDFGIAKLSDASKSLTKTGTKMGSLYYMSPEQVLGHVMDSRTDIYSLGVMLFEMLTNNLPYKTKTESDYELMNSILAQELPNLHEYVSGIDPNIEYAVRKACAKEPVNRFQTCEEFAGALKNSGFTFYAPSTDHSKTILTTGSQTEFTGNRTVYQPQPEQMYATPSSSKSKSSTRKVGLMSGITGLILMTLVIVYFLTRDSDSDTSSSSSNLSSNSTSTSSGTSSSNTTSSNTSSSSSSSQISQPENVVKWFINDLGKRDFSSAYNLQRNKAWGSLSFFSSTKSFGGITSTSLNETRTNYESSSDASVYVDYYSYDPVNKDGRYKQNFLPGKISGRLERLKENVSVEQW